MKVPQLKTAYKERESVCVYTIVVTKDLKTWLKIKEGLFFLNKPFFSCTVRNMEENIISIFNEKVEFKASKQTKESGKCPSWWQSQIYESVP